MSDYIPTLEDFASQANRIKKALPNIPTIRIDPHLLELREARRFSYAFFDGCTRRSPCAQLHIAADPARLPTERDPRLWVSPPTPKRLKSSLGAGIQRAIHLLGGCGPSASRVIQQLGKFGIVRDERSYGYRPEALNDVEELAAEAIARCLAHLIDPRPDPQIHAVSYPVARANPALSPRTLRGQNWAHGSTLRTAA